MPTTSADGCADVHGRFRAEEETPCCLPGIASVQWRIDDGYLTAVVEIPTGTTARIKLPGLEPAEVGSGHHEFAVQLVS
ncbi:MAG: alpha-L-rhamnosidase C-terminal domain-containing protein [Paenarthrobacter sp.]